MTTEQTPAPSLRDKVAQAIFRALSNRVPSNPEKALYHETDAAIAAMTAHMLRPEAIEAAAKAYTGKDTVTGDKCWDMTAAIRAAIEQGGEK